MEFVLVHRTRPVRKWRKVITLRVLRNVSQSRNFAYMRTVTDPGDLLTVGQVAVELDKPPRTIHHWISIGRIAAVKIGTGQTSAYVITRTEVERLKSEAAA